MSLRNRVRPAPHVARSEAGVSLVALLGVVVILGVLLLFAMRSTPSVVLPGSAGAGSLGSVTMPKGPAGDFTIATVATCKADFLTLGVALVTYRSLGNPDPPQGRSWATTGGSSALVRAWPVLAGFSFVWDGSTLSVVPASGTPSHGSYGSSVPPTGCYAK